jgi:formylglycine-generating enzyme required for sulfatase activity
LKKQLITLIISLLVWQIAKPSGVELTELEVVSNQIQFKIAWDYSWNKPNQTPNNHDAVWLFAKYKDVNEIWHPLYFQANNQWLGRYGELQAQTKDGQGVIIRGLNIGESSVFDKITVQLTSNLPSDAVDIQLFATEMVFVPGSPYYLGDGVSEKHIYDASTGLPYLISSESQIIVDSVNGLWADEIGFENHIPASFPKGCTGFYAMKYEISQDQYVAFLNTLTLNQQQNRVKTSPTSPSRSFAFYNGSNVFNRNGVVIEQSGNITTQQAAFFSVDGNNDGVFNNDSDGGNRACNFLNYADLLAYMDWAGIRPMTEFEFEKMARGPLQPIEKEFAWGTPYVVDANTAINDGEPNESVQETGNDSIGLASHGYAGLTGGLRNGFAATTNTNRTRAGASYYGVMELSGNLWEYVVKALNQGLFFNGNNGDGELAINGNANQPGWEPDGGGHKGGAWNSGVVGVFRDLAISDRFYIDLATNNRRNTTGGRGVLTW